MTAWGDLTGRGMRLQKLKMQPQKSEYRIQKTEESRSYMQQVMAANRCMDFLQWRQCDQGRDFRAGSF